MKNRCTHQGNQLRPKSLTIATTRELRPVNTIQWMVFLLVVSVLILFLQQPAWGSELKLKCNPKGTQSASYAMLSPNGAHTAYASYAQSSTIRSNGGSGSDGSSGGCFISASASEASGNILLIGFSLIALIYGLRLVIRSVKHEKQIK